MAKGEYAHGVIALIKPNGRHRALSVYSAEEEPLDFSLFVEDLKKYYNDSRVVGACSLVGAVWNEKLRSVSELEKEVWRTDNE